MPMEKYQEQPVDTVIDFARQDLRHCKQSGLITEVGMIIYLSIFVHH